MTDTIKKYAPIIHSEVQKAKHILLHCHPSPDPDSVGSVLAMKLALEQLGKKVTLIKGDSEIPKAFAFPSDETITQKSYPEVDLKDFDLFTAGGGCLLSSQKGIYRDVLDNLSQESSLDDFYVSYDY